MSATETPLLVFGATGWQGGAVARHLTARGWKVRTLVHDPGKPSAPQLKHQGVNRLQKWR